MITEFASIMPPPCLLVCVQAVQHTNGLPGEE